MKNEIVCKHCGNVFFKKAKSCPNCGTKHKKPIYKRIWVWILIIIIAFGVGFGGSSDTSTTSDSNTEISAQVEDNVSQEYRNALKKAEIYSDEMYMSKDGIYKQLTSEYGEGFPEDAAQYAVDNIDADWNYNALKKAEVYYTDMAMSKDAIYDQLISEHGESFTKEQAQYAIDNLK